MPNVDMSTNTAVQTPIYAYDPNLWSLNDHSFTRSEGLAIFFIDS